MSRSVPEFIAAVRLADSLEEERFIIADEQADMRTYIKECDPELRPRIVAKLIFLNILGENVAYGQMEVLTLMSNEEFSYKRIGYLAASLLLNETSELTVLLTHTVMKDLQSGNRRIQCLALSLIANIGSREMCQEAVTEVQRLVDTGQPSVMKRAAMAAVRIVERIPDVAESFRPAVQKLLKHGSHGVVISAINLMERMIKAQPELAQPYSRYQPAFVKILKQLSTTKASREFQFSSFNDPFLLLKIMRILAVIKRPSDELDDALVSIATGVDIRRNTGRSLLFQAVETIVATAKKPSLRGLAFSQIGKLFKYKEANFLYSALSAFSRILYNGREIVDRTSGDSIALQRYKTLVVQCLNHKDASIRRRALDVVSALIDENNVQSLVPEVLDYVKLADKEFRIDLVAKIFTAVQRFAPSIKWNFDTVHRIILENGSFVGADLVTSFCKLILHTPNLQKYAVDTLSSSMINNSSNQTLVQVSAWVIGEFMTQDADTYDTLKRIMAMTQTTSQTKGYLITAISKLAVRFNNKKDAIEFFTSLLKSNTLDVQQRAGELVKLLAKEPLCNEVLAPIESAEASEQPQTATLVGDTTDSLLDLAGPQESKPIDRIGDDDDLLLIMQDGPAEQMKKKTGSLRDLLDQIPDPQPVLLDAQTPEKAMPIKPFPGSVEAMRKSDYVMYFEIRKNPQNQKQIAIRVSVFNLSSTQFTNFQMKFGVPVGWGLQAQAPSSTTLEPVGGKPITQQIMVMTQTDVPLRMKTMISYQYGSQPVKENGEINPIFD